MSPRKLRLIGFFIFFSALSSHGQQVWPYLPHHNAITGDTRMQFSWRKIPNASQYRLELSTDSLFSAPVTYPTTATSFTVTNLNWGATYWWRVSTDGGPYGFQRKFRVVDFKSFAPLSLWLRADSGVVRDANNLVSVWKDQSDSARTATQSVLSRRPVWVPKGFNDRPVIRFGRNNQQTSLGFAKLNFPGGLFTFFSVWQVVNNNTTLQYLLSNVENGQFSAGIFIGGTLSGGFNSGSTDPDFYRSAAGGMDLSLNQTTIKRNSIYRNGQSLAVTGNQPVPFLAVNSVGARSDITADFYTNADVGEILMYQSEVADSVRSLVERYIAAKYARPAILPADTVVCGPSVTLVLPGGPDEFSSIVWSTGSPAASITVNTDGIYWVRGISRLGGYTTTDTIRVSGILPLPVISPATDQILCFNRDTVAFVNLSSAPGSNFVWSTGETTDTIRVTDRTSVFLKTFDLSSGCLLTSDTVKLKNKIKADFANPAACPGVAATFHDLSSDALGDAVTSWQWNFGDPTTTADVSTDPDGVWTYAQSGTYSVYLRVGTSDGCADSVVKNVVVKPSAVPNFTWQGACYGKPTQFFDQSVPQPGTQVTGYQWTFNNGVVSSFVNPAVVFSAGNIYPVTLKIFTASGCSETIVQQVPVNKGAYAAFGLADSLCAKQNVGELDQSQGVNDNITGWVWRFGSAAPVLGQHPVFAFQGTGSRVVRLTVTTAAGCADSVQKTVLVRPAPTADFSFNVNGGTPPFSPVVVNHSTDADHVAWNFGSGFTETAYTPQLPVYADTGIYTVTLAVRNDEGCADTASKNFVVFTGDRTLQMLSATCTPADGFMQYTARVLNKGGLEVNRITFGADTDYNSVIKESWTGSLLPGQVLEYALSASSKYYTAADFCCVRIDNFNDTLTVKAPDNEICRPLTDKTWFSAAYPTPTDGTVTIDRILPFADKLDAVLCGADGKVLRVLYNKQAVGAGLGTLTADISDLRAGMYVVRFTYREKTYSVKVVKK